MASKLDRENRRTPQLNPEKSGIRSGNPQLKTREAKRRSPSSGKHPAARRAPRRG